MMHAPRHNLPLFVALLAACSDGDGNHGEAARDASLSASHDAAIDAQTSAASNPVCLITCELNAARCDYMEQAANSTYESRLAEWATRCHPDGGRAIHVSEVTCDHGVRRLDLDQGLGSEFHYFDAAGRFLGMRTISDAMDQICLGERYWPVYVECTNPIKKQYC